jgi:hypothetical protein
MDQKRFDVFLSYNSEDREAVQAVAVHLADRAKMAPWFDRWELIPGEPWGEHLERGLKAAATCAVFVGKSGQGPWQTKELYAALDCQGNGPDFRVIPVRLPDAPSVPELPLFLSGNTWVEMSHLEDDDALWRLECGIRGVCPGRGRPRDGDDERITHPAPRPEVDPSSLMLPGGAVDVDSRFYIQREADEAVFSAIRKPRGLVTVRGPRQTGKTSLIQQAYVNTKKAARPLRSVFVDFQGLAFQDLESQEAVWRAVAVSAAAQLGVQPPMPDSWSSGPGVSYDRNITLFLERNVLASDAGPIVLFLDEVDRVFSTPLKEDFFPSVRAFFNRGAWDPPWKAVRWVLSTSSEPSFFIQDLTQSPFNVGLRIELDSFTAEQTAEFARRHGLTATDDLIGRIMDFTGGRPYLVHLLLYHMALDPASKDRLFDAESAGGGVFWDHLKHYQRQIQAEAGLCNAFQEIIAGNLCEDIRLAERLEAAGLVRRNADLSLACACGLYRNHFAGVPCP